MSIVISSEQVSLAAFADVAENALDDLPLSGPVRRREIVYLTEQNIAAYCSTSTMCEGQTIYARTGNAKAGLRVVRRRPGAVATRRRRLLLREQRRDVGAGRWRWKQADEVFSILSVDVIWRWRALKLGDNYLSFSVCGGV